MQGYILLKRGPGVQVAEDNGSKRKYQRKYVIAGMSDVTLQSTVGSSQPLTLATAANIANTVPTNGIPHASSGGVVKWLPNSLTLQGAKYDVDTLRLRTEVYVELKDQYTDDRDPT